MTENIAARNPPETSLFAAKAAFHGTFDSVDVQGVLSS